jgi:hypothetical protein
MDKNDVNDSEYIEDVILKNVDIILHFSLIIALLVGGLFGWINWFLIQSTLLGMLVAAAGGIIIGFFANRYLGNSRNNREIILGMTTTVGLGVLTIGYLYIFYIKGPMSSIGTLERTVKQIFIFLEFLIAHLSGFRLGKRFLP